MAGSLTDLVTGKFERNIIDGVWASGDYIPSTRVLAEREGVSRGVITAAISILVGKGYLERVARHGIKVCEKFRKTDVDRIMDIAGSTDVNLAREYAFKCMNIINERTQGNGNEVIDDDAKMLMQCFGDILRENIAGIGNAIDKDSFNELDKKIYSKGLRCAGWPPERYTLYQCNLSEDVSDLKRGKFLQFEFDKDDVTFDDRTMDYVEKRVHPNDAGKYLFHMKKQKLIDIAHEGERTISVEYREKRESIYKWVKLTINISIDDNSDVLLFLLYQDIDEDKKNEMLQKELSEEDALTGALNRRAFILQAEQLIAHSDDSTQHALLMLDVDGFKAINDLFGHPVGDSVLSDIAKTIRSVLKQGDILGRIGGDEFMICLKGMPYDALIEKRANQIRNLVKRNFDNGALISASIGVTVYPRDGSCFEDLYKKADIALFHAKDDGNNRVEFYTEGMTRNDTVSSKILTSEEVKTHGIESGDMNDNNTETSIEVPIPVKKKILIVDDNDISREYLAEILADEYVPLQAKDGRRALMTLRRYGANISAVLLDLIMPEINGFVVLQSMQRENIMKTIPVIIVSAADGDDSEYKAIEMGAMDFVPKPVDPRLLKLRVHNAVNKKENERLRIQNSYFQLQEDEEAKYRFVVQCTGIILIEHDWVNGIFIYDKMIGQCLAGKYDHRTLWRILLSDMVASSMTVKDMQGMVYRLANNRKVTSDSMRVQLKTRSGEKHWFNMFAYKVADGLMITNKLLITLKDINDEVLAEDKLRVMAEYDSLTKLYNRNTFLYKAEELIKAGQPSKWELGIIDIDNFKVFNHLYGHNAGDHLLSYVAGVLNASVTRTGGICGRIQSDVFSFLQISESGVIEKTMISIMDALDKYSRGKKITTSVGRYLVNDTEISINAMLDRAVIAHSNAKNGPTRNVLFTSSMQRKLLNEQEILSSMEMALRDNQFEIYLQPIYEFSTNKIVTAEALVRWIHPVKGIIPPGEFISLFEQNGFIFNLDSYVWERACHYLNRWNNEGMDIVPISVNVSRLDIYEQNFIPRLATILQKYRVEPDCLRLEITESACVDGTEHIIEIVNKLKKCGFIVELDDFGSGFSSLNILSEVPVDILKLDMKFLSGEDKTGKKDAIVEHVISMAKTTNMGVIAEGVETLEQAELLNRYGCSLMQGYYYSKPVMVKEFEELLKISNHKDQ